MQKFDYNLDFKTIDFRQQPELYRVGKGEQGVLLVQPYKGEILPHWRFKTPAIARQSAQKIYELFLAYKQQQDFVGMDMARKFLTEIIVNKLTLEGGTFNLILDELSSTKEYKLNQLQLK